MSITQLKQVLPRVFDELVQPETKSYDEVRDSCGHRTQIQVGRATTCGTDGQIVLALVTKPGFEGRFYSDRLLVFGHPVEITEFSDSGRPDSQPLLECTFQTDDPPYTPTRSSQWHRGKGHWVKEYLFVAYDQHNCNHCLEVSGKEFEFVLDVQQRIQRIVKDVDCRGHWQNEWHPTGHYLKETIVD